MRRLPLPDHYWPCARRDLDAPARRTAEGVGRDLDKVGVFERNGIIGERSKSEIGIQTIRGGDIVGEHTIYYCGPGERIELTHRAHNRDNFARGAAEAAAWLSGKSTGMFTMFDVLGLGDL